MTEKRKMKFFSRDFTLSSGFQSNLQVRAFILLLLAFFAMPVIFSVFDFPGLRSRYALIAQSANSGLTTLESDVFDDSKPMDFAFFGDSSALSALIPRFWEEAIFKNSGKQLRGVSFAHLSMGYDFDYYLLRDMIGRGRKPKLIIFNLSRLEQTKPSYFSRYVKKDPILLGNSVEVAARVSFRSWMGDVIMAPVFAWQAVRGLRETKSTVGPQWGPYLKDQAPEFVERIKKDFHTTDGGRLAAADLIKSGAKIGHSMFADHYLNKFFELCQQNKIKIVYYVFTYNPNDPAMDSRVMSHAETQRTARLARAPVASVTRQWPAEDTKKLYEGLTHMSEVGAFATAQWGAAALADIFAEL